MSLDGRKPATEDLSVRMLRKILPAVGLWLFVLGSVWPVDAQRAGTFKGSSDDPAIGYSTTTTLNNAVVEVNKRLQDGTVRLRFDERSGFLQSALEALQIPVDSQLLVFSRFSLQRKLINEQNPRALFFNDRVALGWVRGGDVLEVAAHDQSAGVVFYTLRTACRCHQRTTAVQAGVRVPRVSRDGQHTRRARSADVQHDTPGTVRVFRSAAPHRSQRCAPAAVWRLVRHRQYRLSAAHG